MYVPLPTPEVAKSVELIANATNLLQEGDSVSYLTEAEPPATFNRDFHVVPDSLTELLVHESLVNNSRMNLIIKKPDFLGDSRWEFRHGASAFPANLVDMPWLAKFRSGAAIIQPGDALRALVRSTVRYGYDGDVVDTHHEVIQVIDVMRALRPSQVALFTPPEDPGNRKPGS